MECESALRAAIDICAALMIIIVLILVVKK